MIGSDCAPFQLSHEISAPVLAEHPRINRNHVQSGFKVCALLDLDAFIIGLMSCESVMFDVGLEFR